MDILLLIVRWLAAIFFGAVSFMLVKEFLQHKTAGTVVKICGCAISVFLAGLAGWLVFLRWEVLAGAGAALVLGVGVMVIAHFRAHIRRSRARSQALKIVVQLAEKTRKEPMPLDEAEERMAAGGEVAIAAALKERQLGQSLTSSEFAEFAAVHTRDIAERERKEKQEAEQDELRRNAEEQQQEALEAEMRTGEASSRLVRVALAAEFTVSGIKGQEMCLPAGTHDLSIRMKLEGRPEDTDGYPVILTEIKTGDGAAITRRIALMDLIVLEEIQQACAWRSQSEEWRETFKRSVLLEALDGADDGGNWIEFPVDGRKTGFLTRHCGMVITLACPEPGDKVWCRIHSLEHPNFREDGEEEETGDDDDYYKTEPPFCFSLGADRLLRVEGQFDEE